MREGFNELLQEYGGIAKDAKSKGLSVDRDPQLKHTLKQKRREAASEFATSPETQALIFQIQERKQALVAEYRQAVRELDSSNQEPRPGARSVICQQGEYLVEGRNGRLVAATRGEILTDGEWGLVYQPDQSVDRPTRLGLLKSAARRELRQLYNQQIVLQESHSGLTHEYKQQAYERMRRDHEAGILHPGEIAEKMVRNFLTKLTIDHEIDFEIMEADVFQDVDQKIDFIIHRKSYRKGVNVVADESEKSVGIQFTTSQDAATLSHKQHQVDSAKQRIHHTPVDDIVLVSLPVSEFMNAYNTWNNQRTPGGPDKLWSAETQEHIFYEVMKGVFTADEIAREWEAVAGEATELPMAA